MSARGFSLIELLIATGIVLVIGGTLAAMVAPLRSVVFRVHASEEIDTGARVALYRIAADVREAGNGASVAPAGVSLARVLPAITTVRDLDSSEAANPGNALLLTLTPHLGAQGTLASDALAGDTLLRLDTSARCAMGAPGCGFAVGDSAVLYSHSAAALVTVDAVGAAHVLITAPLTAAVAAGAVLAEVVTVRYGTRAAGDGSFRLVRAVGAGPEQPLLDNVVQFEAALDPADPGTAARALLKLRLQAPSPELRGPAGYLFRISGTATDSRRWLPDVELRLTVAFRSRAAW